MLHIKKLGFIFLFFIFMVPLSAWGAEISVNSFSDLLDATDEVCTLREALINANNDAQTYDDCTQGSGDDTISIPAGTYCLSLTNSSGDEDVSATGDLDILANVTLTGAGASSTIIDAGSSSGSAGRGCTTELGDRVIELATSSLTVSISGITITGGELTTSADGAYGGGIYFPTSTNLTLTNSTVTGNSATTTSGDNAKGGGIYGYYNSTLTLTNSTISENTATNGSNDAYGGGIYLYSSSTYPSTLTLTGATISDNTASGSRAYGGGIYAYRYTTITASGGSTISGNTATGSSSYARGGGIYAYNGVTITLTNSTLSGNSITSSASKTYGGGIYLYSTSSYPSTLTLTGATISDNSATAATYAYGGGLMISTYSTVSVLNTTISNNTATGGSTTGGGGLYQDAGTLNLTATTISENTSTSSSSSYGGGMYASGTTVNIKNTLLSGNTSTGSTASDGANCYNSTALQTYGYNFIGLVTTTSNCTLSTTESTDVIDKTHSELLLVDLADNGGSTNTHALSESSPAINTGNCTQIDGTTTISTDQRGQSRSDGSCDMGAFEYQASPTCGDGYVDSPEDCDDSNTDSADGCSSTCTGETDSDADGYYAIVQDCNDSDSTINPGAEETCNSVDDDCDGTVDDGVTTTYYQDADGDGVGGGTSTAACSAPSGYVATGGDCNDSDATTTAACPDTGEEEEEEPADVPDDTTDVADAADDTPPAEEPQGCQLHASASRSSQNLGWLFFLPFVGVLMIRNRKSWKC